MTTAFICVTKCGNISFSHFNSKDKTILKSDEHPIQTAFNPLAASVHAIFKKCLIESRQGEHTCGLDSFQRLAALLTHH